MKRDIADLMRASMSEESKKRIEEQVVAQMQRELAECTFHPNVNTKRRYKKAQQVRFFASRDLVDRVCLSPHLRLMRCTCIAQRRSVAVFSPSGCAATRSHLKCRMRTKTGQ
jgi:hypothetical protein